MFHLDIQGFFASTEAMVPANPSQCKLGMYVRALHEIPSCHIHDIVQLYFSVFVVSLAVLAVVIYFGWNPLFAFGNSSAAKKSRKKYRTCNNFFGATDDPRLPRTAAAPTFSERRVICAEHDIRLILVQYITRI